MMFVAVGESSKQNENEDEVFIVYVWLSVSLLLEKVRKHRNEWRKWQEFTFYVRLALCYNKMRNIFLSSKWMN